MVEFTRNSLVVMNSEGYFGNKIAVNSSSAARDNRAHFLPILQLSDAVVIGVKG